MTTPLALDSDRRLAIVAGAGMALSVAAALAGTAELLPPGPAALLVIVGVTLGLRVALTYATRSASSPARTRVMNLVSTVGLSLSALAAVAALPRITSTAGLGTFQADLAAQLWTLAILTALAAPVRTLGSRALVGSALTGFLAITSLARLVARPTVVALGRTSLLATALWVPLSEEIIKLLPLGLVLLLALRRTQLRPSALDLMLVGAWTGAGFALYENAALGRGGFHLDAVPILSLFFPSETEGRAVGWTVVQSGHLVHTALIGLGIGVALLYRKRVPRFWIVGVVAVVAVLLEHMGQNALAESHLDTTVAHVVLALTLNGRLTSLFLLAGIGAVLAFEWRNVGSRMHLPDWIRLPLAEASRRAARLAQSQGVSTNEPFSGESLT